MAAVVEEEAAAPREEDVVVPSGDAGDGSSSRRDMKNQQQPPLVHLDVELGLKDDDAGKSAPISARAGASYMQQVGVAGAAWGLVCCRARRSAPAPAPRICKSCWLQGF